MDAGGIFLCSTLCKPSSIIIRASIYIMDCDILYSFWWGVFLRSLTITNGHSMINPDSELSYYLFHIPTFQRQPLNTISNTIYHTLHKTPNLRQILRLPRRLLPLVCGLQQLEHPRIRLLVRREDVVHILLVAVVVQLSPLLDLARHLHFNLLDVCRGAVGILERFPGVEKDNSLCYVLILALTPANQSPSQGSYNAPLPSSLSP